MLEADWLVIWAASVPWRHVVQLKLCVTTRLGGRIRRTWAGDNGAQQWVIVTAATNPADRVYRRACFALAEPIVTAYRPPA